MTRSLLCVAALLLAGQAQAYVILESKYRVEVKPGVFEDQLVLRCDDGKKITVPWEARLSEACGEVDIPRAGGAAAAIRDSSAEPQDVREPHKEIMMSRMREQSGDVDERHVAAESGLDGAASHFSPQMREVLKRYEVCRKNTKGSPTCATERNQAMAALKAPGSGNGAASAQSSGEPQPAAPVKGDAAIRHKQAAAKPAPKPVAPSAEPVNAEAAPIKPPVDSTPAAMPAPPAHGEAETVAAAAAAAPAAASPEPDRAARAERIAQDYASCMRAKPKFECETARAAALKALDAPPKIKTKSKSAAKAVPAPAVAAN